MNKELLRNFLSFTTFSISLVYFFISDYFFYNLMRILLIPLQLLDFLM